MAVRDKQFQPLGSGNAPQSWTLPSSANIIPKAATAVFDGTGAGGDFKPAMEIYSDSGALVSRVVTDEVVAAGGSAEVTFAPFLRSAPATSAGLHAGFAYGSGTFFNPHSGGNATIANNTVAELAWASQSFGGNLVCLDTQSGPPTNGARFTAAAGGFGGPVCDITFHIKVVWPAFAGRRYIELAPDNGDPAYAIPLRLEGSATPQDDIQVLSGTFTEQVGVLTGLVVNCFQASGGPVTLTTTPWCQFLAVGPVTA